MMTDPRVSKLVLLGVTAASAADLVAAGYGTPAEIRNASEEDLLKVLTSGELSAVNVVLPSREQ